MTKIRWAGGRGQSDLFADSCKRRGWNHAGKFSSWLCPQSQCPTSDFSQNLTQGENARYFAGAKLELLFQKFISW